MALFNVFPAENHLHFEVKWVGTGKESVATWASGFHGNKMFISVGVFPVEVLAYQVSMVCAAN